MEARRIQYLQAMGVTAWVSRAAPQPDPVGAPAAVPEPASPRADAPDESAVSSMDWRALRAAVEACRLCPLSESRTRTVFGVGGTEADLLIVGEAPGAEEDRQGEPFVGRAGQLLDAMLAGVSQSRASAYIANVLKCRPPANRDPSTEESTRCAPYLQRQIELIQPRVIVAVGRIAAQRLLGEDLPLARVRGRVHRYGPRRIPLIVTYHPAYLLRRPSEKSKSWRDLLLAAAVLDGANS